MKTIEELKNSIVDINYIIENMIRENGLYCLLGEAKVGKSALALQIANSVCNGIPFLNLNTNKTSVILKIGNSKKTIPASNIKILPHRLCKDTSFFINFFPYFLTICSVSIRDKLAYIWSYVSLFAS